MRLINCPLDKNSLKNVVVDHDFYQLEGFDQGWQGVGLDLKISKFCHHLANSIVKPDLK